MSREGEEDISVEEEVGDQKSVGWSGEGTLSL